MTSIMGGKVLEYEAKTIYKRGIHDGYYEGINKGRAEGRTEGRNEGRNEGAIERSEQVFVNMITRGFSYEDAVAISEISESRAKELMVDIKQNA